MEKYIANETTITRIDMLKDAIKVFEERGMMEHCTTAALMVVSLEKAKAKSHERSDKNRAERIKKEIAILNEKMPFEEPMTMTEIAGLLGYIDYKGKPSTQKARTVVNTLVDSNKLVRGKVGTQVFFTRIA